ncbi:type I restriction endonuclease subunit R [Hymenobacter wooponensis]|uniref:Type I restriction enzyme endonuclease subunit n=1 Tax=Hymenobacter wooponensis TaxID=1525360 RepID=A0A4Z0MNC2_9BACT|nr:HsdR family type I site-specific deoxyribonuclease [Hymenobacter wooponensis]TGD80808.1 HsdR family type I site-specific deoxyribonuclease [Hymenobacter wooponensis]
MSAKVGQVERATQNRVVELFRSELGYDYLGNWEKYPRRSPIEDEAVRKYLQRQQHPASLIDKVLRKLHAAVENQTEKLYKRNRELYKLLRYGVKVRPEAGAKKLTVELVNWATPLANDFALAQEVTVQGPTYTKRPDVVLYLNGLAVAVLELKRSTVSVQEAIRQNLDNQKSEFIENFFAPVQLVLAGNDTEGMRYGTVGTSEKYYLEWHEEVPGKSETPSTKAGDGEAGAAPLPPPTSLLTPQPLRLDEHLRQLCRKERLLALMHDFVVFDRGIKKLCRPNQFFGVQAAQQYIKRREGGIIWHTQGSGKSLTMVWLAKWLLEHDPQARVLIVTDREELDEQIEKVFLGVEQPITRAKSGADLLHHLSQPMPRLLCSLVHKFGARTEAEAYDKYLEDLMRAAGRSGQAFRPQGQLYVLVDECHRTQSGKLHEAMHELLPGALLIGFTGTPLLRTAKRTTLETFGPYIHTYRVDKAVADGVILELRYEARKVEQYLTESGKRKMDEYFELKTKDLNEYGRARLKEKWGTMQKVLSSKERMDHIVADIVLDMEKKERLQSGRGNALLVSGSIFQACRYYELFQRAGFKQCAIVTSYQPKTSDLKGETTGEGGDTEQLQKYKIYIDMLGGKAVADFEKEVKRQFVEEPAQMKLLIVVDKLLTGFDAPSATYLYIDKEMRDHNLFQAICRVNRLDGDDKEYGYVVDYKDLFKALEDSIRDYTSEALDGFDKSDVQGLLTDRLIRGREHLEDVLEQLRLLCEPVAPPRGQPEYQHFFCGNPANPADLSEREGRRRDLYKYTAILLRAFAEISGDLEEADYTASEAAGVERQVRHYEKLRDEVKVASGEAPDLKRYEADMRFLFDNYVKAEDSEKQGTLDDLSLIEAIVARGLADTTQRLPKGIRESRESMAETIENNVRKLIIDENQTNPKYFERMSVLLEELIARRQREAIEYEAYLAEIEELCRKVATPPTHYPPTLHTRAQRNLYDNLGESEELALAVDAAILDVRQDGWRGDTPPAKKRMVRNAIKAVLNNDEETTRILNLAMQQAEY